MRKVLIILLTLLVVFLFATFEDEGQTEDQLTIDEVEEEKSINNNYKTKDSIQYSEGNGSQTQQTDYYGETNRQQTNGNENNNNQVDGEDNVIIN